MVLATVVTVGACASSGNRASRGPNPSGSIDPGPNSTSVTNPGPNSTVRGPDTIGGRLRITGSCAQLVGSGATPADYELVVSRGWRTGASGLVVDGQLAARPGDQVFVSGRRLASKGRCGARFAAEHLVSVIPR